MDINSPISAKTLFASNRSAENALNLKVGQQLDVKVLSAEIQAAKNAITLTLGNKDITVQSNQPVTLSPRQDLKLQVTQIAPSVEFKILASPPEQNDLRLKLMPTARDGGSAASGRESMRPTARDGENIASVRNPLQSAAKPDASAFPLSPKQLLDAKVIGTAGNKIQLQVFNSPVQASAEPGNKQAAFINIDKNQLTNAPQGLKIGQNLNLEVIKTGATPELKVISSTKNIGPPLEARIIAITGNKIQLQVSAQAKTNPPITIDRAQLSNAPSNLKVGQSLNLEIIKTGISPEFKVIPPANSINSPLEAKIIAVIGNKIQLQVSGQAKTNPPITIDRAQLSNAPSNLKVGQNLNLEITKTGVSPEFKVIPPANNIGPPLEAKIIAVTGNKVQLQVSAQAKTDTVITIERAQLSNAPPDLKVGQNLNLEIIKTGISSEFKVIPPANSINSPLEAKIIAVTGNKIQLQVSGQAKTDTIITIERAQLSNASPDLKVGQNLNLEIIKTGTAPEFKIIPAANTIPETAVTEFIKQFLPRHEDSPILLNQLIKDLPQLMKNESVSQALKDIAASIIRNLPAKEQLISSQGLKQAIANSGLFLEAKLPSAMSPTELIKQLPQLIKNESVPQSLQRIAVEILQNLTQKEPLSSSIEQAINPMPISEAASLPPGLNPAKPINAAKVDGVQTEVIEKFKAGILDDAEAIAVTGDKALPGAVAEDFKANLLKFIQALKQELAPQDEQQRLQVDLDLLKNLQNKAENTVAKIVLEQLMSLPKDDNPKQLWSIDIPFIDRQQAETVKIEIQQDKANQQQQSGNSDWSVNITITPPELGTIQCIVSFRNDVINTYFKSRNPQTTELIKHNLDYLKSQLEEAGLTTGHMDAHDDAQKTQPSHQLAGKKLFDEKV